MLRLHNAIMKSNEILSVCTALSINQHSGANQTRLLDCTGLHLKGLK